MMLLTNFSVPDNGVVHQQDTTQAFVDGNCIGDGTLYITENHVTWLTGSGQGFCLEYPKICLHAVSRDLTSFPQECLYLMVEGKLIEEEQEVSSDEDNDDDNSQTTEVRFVPADKGAIDAMFGAMSDCQALHPDPEDEQSDEDNDEFYVEEEGGDRLTEEGRRVAHHLDNLLLAGQGDGQPASNGTETHHPDAMEASEEGGQFDDADMDE